MAPGSPEELHYLLGIFPPALLTKLPNVRTWAIQGADYNGSQKTSSKPRALSFHKATLIQLRYSRIEELHLSHILFTSDAELIRLVGSMRHLRRLRYTDIRVQKHRCIVSPNPTTRTVLRGLSTLDIHVPNTEDETADALIEMAQHTLRNLTVHLHPRAKWGSIRSTARKPVQLKLDTLTFHVELDGDLSPGSLANFALGMCQYATNRISTFHRGSTVKELAIHIISSVSLPSASLALRLIESEFFLDQFRSMHLDLVGQVPSRFTLHIHLPLRSQARGVVVQGTVLASDNFIFEESYKQQVDYYSEGVYANTRDNASGESLNGNDGNTDNIWRNMSKNDIDSVVALAISPDGKRIASGSRQHAILWNIAAPAEDHHPQEMVYEWIVPVEDDSFTRPLAFSPDSQALACCSRDPEAFVQVRNVHTGKCLAVLRAPADARMGALDTCRASCIWAPSGEALVSVVFIQPQQFLVQVWDTENYRLISTTTQITSFHSPSFIYSPNGRWLASFQTARGPSQSPPSTSPQPDVTAACTVLGALLTEVPTNCHILSATFDQASTRFAAISSDHVLHVWSLRTGAKLLQVPMNEHPHDPERLVLAFSPDGTQLLSCSGGRGAAFVLTIRDAASGRTLLPRRPAYHFLRARTAPQFVFSDDRKYLLSASEDGFVQMWRAADASFVRDIARDGDVPTVFAWSEEGQTLAWGTVSGGVVVKSL